MIRPRRIRLALRTTLALVGFELGLAVLAAGSSARPLATITGAGLDPSRLASAVVELRDSFRLGALVAPLVSFVAPIVTMLVVEPFLLVVFVRAHALPHEQAPPRIVRRAFTLLAGRALLLFAFAIGAALAVGAVVVTQIALDGIRDPRVADLVSLAILVATSLFAAALYFVAERFTIHVALDSTRVFESLLDAFRTISFRFVAARTLALFLSSLFLVLAPGALDSRAALAALAAMTLGRMTIRSAFLAYAVDDDARTGRIRALDADVSSARGSEPVLPNSTELAVASTEET